MGFVCGGSPSGFCVLSSGLASSVGLTSSAGFASVGFCVSPGTVSTTAAVATAPKHMPELAQATTGLGFDAKAQTVMANGPQAWHPYWYKL